jgi:ATP-binding cassette subfamily B protein
MHEIVHFFAKHPSLTGLSFVSIFSFPLQEVVLPMFYGQWMDNIKDSSAVLRCSLIIVVLWILAIVLRILYDYTELKVNSMLESHVREESYKKLFHYLEMHPEQEIHRMELITQLTKYPLFTTEIYNFMIESICPSLLLLLFVDVYLFFVDRQLFYIFSVNVLVVIVLSYFIIPVIINQSKNRDNHHNKILSNMEDVLNNSSVVYIQGTTDQELGVIENQERRFRDIYETYSFHLLIYRNIVLVIFLLIVFYILYKAYRLFLIQKIGTGTIVTLFIIFTYWISDVIKLFDKLAYLIYFLGNLHSTEEKISHILLHSSSSSSSPSLMPSAPPKDIHLSLQNIGFRHKGKWILKNFSLNIQRGTTTIVRGKIGVGKTTLLKIILGLLEITEGTMILNQSVLFHPNIRREWRQNFIYMPQEAILFGRSLYENLIYGYSISREECMDQLKQHGYVPLLVKSLKDLDRNVGKDGSNLSGGQRRLVLLFRCLLSSSTQRGSFLVLDEPTSNLDAQTHDLVLRLIETLSKKETMMIISHDKILYQKYTVLDMRAPQPMN